MSEIKREDLLGKMMICYHCGHRNLITNPKCTTCGKPLKSVKIKNEEGREIGEVIKDDNGQIISIETYKTTKTSGCLGTTILFFVPVILIIFGVYVVIS